MFSSQIYRAFAIAETKLTCELRGTRPSSRRRRVRRRDGLVTIPRVIRSSSVDFVAAPAFADHPSPANVRATEPAMPTIDYYMSLNSPWTYLGAQRFMEIAKQHKCKVNVKPARFAEVFAKTGGLPLAKRAPERQAYRMMELKRWRDHLDIPIVLQPKHFPSDEAPGTRLVIAAQLKGMDALAFSREIGRSLWERDESIADTIVLASAARRAGLDLSDIRAKAPSDAELDKIWDANTHEAVAQGVFGAPSYRLASGEFFWGQDRLEFLERALAKG
jgi:2-hydroxychromene-2-carboxylate isomerase